MNESNKLHQKPHPLLSPTPILSKRQILDLDEIEGSDLALVGGKAFRLAQLRKYGLTVPSGLVLTADFFEAQITATKLMPLWAGSPDIAVTAEALDWLADAIKLKPLVKELATDLQTRLQLKFNANINSFAVRSSVIDEDQRDHSFAGMHLTELGVPRTALPIAITRCWASALSGPAVEYRQVHGLSIQGIRIALIIQPMLVPEGAGVAFTINPLTGARDEIVVEATWGLGNPLVSGQVQPYFYRIAAQPPSYPVIEQHAGNVLPTVDDTVMTGNEPLTTEQITILAQQVEQIQALMGEPQDIEWAFQDATFFILQTRPITTMPKAEATQNLEWSRNGYPQSLPDLPSPLFGAFLESTQPQIIRVFKALGIKINQVDLHEKLILGRPYLNLTLLKSIMAQLGLTSNTLLSILGDSNVATTSAIFTIDWKTAWVARQVYRAIFNQLRQTVNKLPEFHKSLGQDIATFYSPQPNTSSDQLLAQLRRQIQLYSQIKTNELSLTCSRIITIGLGSKVLAPASQTPISEMMALATAKAKLSQDQLQQQLISLSKLASTSSLQSDPEHSTDLANNNYVQDNVSAEFKKNFDELLAKFGGQANFAADPARPRYSEAPNLLYERIQSYAKNRALPGYDAPPSLKIFSRLIFWRRWLVKPMINRLGNLLTKQDELHENLTKFMTAVRKWHLTLGQKWTKNDWLEKSEDIFWLTLEEIERTLRIKDDMAVTLPSIIQARKETYQVYAQTNVPFVIKDAEIASIQFGYNSSGDFTAASDVIVGLPVSPGQARGTVVVVRHPAEFQKIASDMILVMPSTDPAWLALLSSAAGLIVETGGLLSHGSVIAREYGLPAVANIPEATQRFQTGDKVLVDGSTGVIQFLELGQSS